VRVRLVAPEADTLASLLTDLVDALQPDGLDRDDPVYRRLYPNGYQGNPEAAEAFRDLTESTLRAERLARAEQCLAGLAAAARDARHRIDATLDPEAAERWLRVLNDMRLAIGTRIGITEDDEFDFDPQAEGAMPRAVYAYLSALQDALVRARMP
jgi:hypothetical protein